MDEKTKKKVSDASTQLPSGKAVKSQAYITNVDNVGMVSKMLGMFQVLSPAPVCWSALKSPPLCFAALA